MIEREKEKNENEKSKGIVVCSGERYRREIKM